VRLYLKNKWMGEVSWRTYPKTELNAEGLGVRLSWWSACLARGGPELTLSGCVTWCLEVVAAAGAVPLFFFYYYVVMT
jgi:hypothetical protein